MKCVSLSVWPASLGADRQTAGFSVNSTVSCALHTFGMKSPFNRHGSLSARHKSRKEEWWMRCWRQPKDDVITWIQRHLSILSDFLVKVFLCNSSVALFQTVLPSGIPQRAPNWVTPRGPLKRISSFPCCSTWQHTEHFTASPWLFSQYHCTTPPPPTARILVSAASDHWCLLGGGTISTWALQTETAPQKDGDVVSVRGDVGVCALFGV